MTELNDLLIGDPGTEEPFAQRLSGAMYTFYRHELGVSGVVLWLEAMQGVCTVNEFARALNQYASETRDGQRLPIPVPADIIARVGGAKNQEAWRKAIFMVRHYGVTHTVEFDDPRIHDAIQAMGGWSEFCRLFDDRRSIDVQRQFMTHYANSKGVQAAPLIGAYGTNARHIRMATSNTGRIAVKVMPALEHKQ